jgi:hypothetical protein
MAYKGLNKGKIIAANGTALTITGIGAKALLTTAFNQSRIIPGTTTL